VSIPTTAVGAPERCGAVAHRGDFSNHTENSKGAARAAIAAGADYIELDVRTTKDHQLVVMHDRRVRRTSTSNGLVANMTLKQFRKIRLDDGTRPPTLAQLLAIIKPSGTDVLVELKAMGRRSTYRDLVAQLRAFGLDRVWVGSFDAAKLDTVAVHAPEIRLAVITRLLHSPDEVAAYDGIMVNKNAFTDDAAALEWLRTMPKAVFIWTSNDSFAWRLAPYVTAVVTDVLAAFRQDRITLCSETP
jgi:glycerophosphoryl diester phosphodiesterase